MATAYNEVFSRHQPCKYGVTTQNFGDFSAFIVRVDVIIYISVIIVAKNNPSDGVEPISETSWHQI
jgi:hypothetical protein